MDASRKLLAVSLAAGMLAASAAFARAAEPRPEALARRLAGLSRASGGVCVVLGREDADLAVAFAQQGPFVVHALYPRESLAEAARERIRAREAQGRVSAHVADGGRLPYAEKLVNVVVADGFPALEERGLSLAEVRRVLRPLGRAFFGVAQAADARRLRAALAEAGFQGVAPVPEAEGWLVAVEPWPPEIDEWTHNCHGADGNPVAEDTAVGPPAHMQWVCGPRWLRAHDTHSSVNGLVTARGRLFYFVDEAPISLPGQHPLPDKWFLVGRDAFNGLLLWKVRVEEWGWRAWKDYWFKRRPGDFPLNLDWRLVAVGDRVYATLGYRAPVSQLDAATGEVLRTYQGTDGTREILHHDGRLILSVPQGDRLRLVALEPQTGSVAWQTPPRYAGTTSEYVYWDKRMPRVDIDPVLNPAAGDGTLCLIDGKEIVALDLATGQERWRTALECERPALWVGSLIVRDSVVLHAEPERLVALDARSGEQLWTQPKKPIGWLWFQWKDVFVIRGQAWTWSGELDQKVYERRGKKRRSRWPATFNAYDLRTGEVRRRVDLDHIFTAQHHHRCYRNKATVRYLLASRRGTEFVDLQGGPHTVHNWVRGTCHLGMLPANGFHYAPPHPCACYIHEKLAGFNALAAARPEPQAEAEPGPRLRRGPAHGQADGPPATDRDWPTYRADMMRSGSTRSELPQRLRSLWAAELGAALAPPVVVGDRVFVPAVDRHHVVALDAADGSKLWEAPAGGRIDSPPTYWRGKLLFGSADGHVYCLRASDGALAWRFRAAPRERLVGAFGQLESAWPVHGSVVVREGLATFAAGRSSYLDGGIHLWSLDAATGEARHHARIEGPETDFSTGEAHFGYGGGPGALPDILQADEQGIYMRNRALDEKLERRRDAAPRIQARGGFLDDTYFRRAFWFYATPRNWARLIVHDTDRFYAVRMFDSLHCLDPKNYFVPGKKGYRLLAQPLEGREPAWAKRVPIRVKAMAVSGERLAIAGPPDVVDPDDPLGAFEGRKGGPLWLLAADSGEVLARAELGAPPVFNGVAAAGGRLYLALADGRLVCLGE
ncbi:MAG: PQQ-binding-like beta-propeller repeat protein [Candidatus Brocadiia bacterium]